MYRSAMILVTVLLALAAVVRIAAEVPAVRRWWAAWRARTAGTPHLLTRPRSVPPPAVPAARVEEPAYVQFLPTRDALLIRGLPGSIRVTWRTLDGFAAWVRAQPDLDLILPAARDGDGPPDVCDVYVPAAHVPRFRADVFAWLETWRRACTLGARRARLPVLVPRAPAGIPRRPPPVPPPDEPDRAS